MLSVINPSFAPPTHVPKVVAEGVVLLDVLIKLLRLIVSSIAEPSMNTKAV